MIYLFNIIFFIFHASLILKRIWIPIIQQCHQYDANAVVTPLRKAASYEQRKTNLGNQTFHAVLSRSAMYYTALKRVSSLPPRRRQDSR